MAHNELPTLLDELEALALAILDGDPSDFEEAAGNTVGTAAAVIRDLAGRVVRLTAERHQLLRELAARPGSSELPEVLDLQAEILTAGGILDAVELGDVIQAAERRHGGRASSTLATAGIAGDIIAHLNRRIAEGGDA